MFATLILLHLTSLVCGVILSLLCLFLTVRAVTWHQHTTMETSGSRRTPQSPSATSGRCLASGLMTTWYSCLLSICCTQKMCKRTVKSWGKGKRSGWGTEKSETKEVLTHKRWSCWQCKGTADYWFSSVWPVFCFLWHVTPLCSGLVTVLFM